MRTFTKLVFIFNLCFVIAVAMRYVEIVKRAKGDYDAAIPFQPLQSSLIVLGYGAIFINVIFLFFFLYWLFTGKSKNLPRWITLFNLLSFPAQVYFFFFYK